jgi:ABC-type Fe3+ transport system permease subunit
MIQQGSFVGLQNYLDLLNRADFRNAISFSAIFAIFSVVGSYIIGLALALLLNQDVPFRGFFPRSIAAAVDYSFYCLHCELALDDCGPKRAGKCNPELV